MKAPPNSNWRLHNRSDFRSQCARTQPGRFSALRAMIKLAAGDTEGALHDVNDALALSPKDPNALQLNGDVLVKMGRGEEAVAFTRQFLASIPSTGKHSCRSDRSHANSA